MGGCVLFFGLLGISQVLFLPGLILIRQIHFESRFLAKSVGVIVSSMVINYCLVFFLTVIKINLPIVWYSIISLEIYVLLFLYRKQLSFRVNDISKQLLDSINNKTSNWKSYFENISEPNSFILLIKLCYVFFSIWVAYVSLNWIWKLFNWNIGSIFDSYDSIVSWNRWAVNWSENILPISTWRYPQLIPANWSIIYQLIGDTSIHFFAKAIMPLFSLFIILMIIDLGIAKKQTGYFIGAGLTYLVFKKFLGSFIVAGLADLPCAFFAFAAFYFFMVYDVSESREKNNTNFAFMVGLCLSGCAITKQVGLLFLFLFMLFFIRFFFLPSIKIDKKKAFVVLIQTILIIAVIVLPWYIYKQILIWQGSEYSEVELIIEATENAYRSNNISFRLINAFRMLEKYSYLLMLLIPFSFFADAHIRVINLIIIFPLFLSWALFSSYDFRNIALALPFFGISSGISIQYIVNWIINILKHIPFPRLEIKYVILFLFLCLLMTSIFFITDDYLKLNHSEKVMNSFAPTLNEKLLIALEENDGEYSILTNYPLEHLPGIEGKKISSTFNNYEDFLFTLSFGKIDYILIPNHAKSEILVYLESKINMGEYILLFDDNSWIPYQFIQILE